MSKSRSDRGETKQSHSSSRRTPWWKPIDEAVSDLDLHGFRVKCPQCGSDGLAVSRWIRGPTVKPLYVLHRDREGDGATCEIEKSRSQDLRKEVFLSKGDILMLLESRKSFVLFSGGKDSLATLVHLRDISRDISVDLNALFVDTTVGLARTTEYVRKVCKYLKVNLEVLKPKTDFFTLARNWGIPGHGYRWCCRELKIKPIAEYLNGIKERKVVFDGIRAVESNLRRQYLPIWYHPTFKCLSVSPIFDWTDQRVYSFIHDNGIPESMMHKLLNTSTECWCGAYKTKSDFKRLYELDRKLYHRLMEVEEENDCRYTFIYAKGEKVSLRDLENQILSKST